MTGFVLQENYTENLVALLRKRRSHTASSSSATHPTNKPVTPTTICYYFYGQQVTLRVIRPYCCQRAHWARYQHRHRKLRTQDWANHDGAGKPFLWFS
jgi:hypothetical protein